jgi:soluble P-type ATPase
MTLCAPARAMGTICFPDLDASRNAPRLKAESFPSFDLVRSAKNFIAFSNTFKIILVGDTMLDIAAAKANDVAIISVATGKDSYSVLKQLKPTMTIKNFKKDIDAFKELVNILMKN